jgi:hypothetical protein
MISGAGAAICTAIVEGDATVDDSTSVSGESVYKMSRSWVEDRSLTSLEYCIWPDAT